MYVFTGREVGPTNQPQEMLMPHCWEPLPPLSPSFSATVANHKIPTVTYVRDLGVPLDTIFTSSVHCREVANIARRLLFMVRRSFSELSRAAFIRMYCAIVWPHTEYAMEANPANLRTDFSHLGGPTPCNMASERPPSRAM